MTNIQDFDSNLLKIDKKSFKNISTYYIGYIAKFEKCCFKNVAIFSQTTQVVQWIYV